MIQYFTREFFKLCVARSKAFSRRRALLLWAVSAPGFLLLLFCVKFNAALSTIPLTEDNFNLTVVASYILINLVKIWVFAQTFLAWTQLGDTRFQKMSAGEIAAFSLRFSWRMIIPFLPLWIILPLCTHFLLLPIFGITKLLLPLGNVYAVFGAVWYLLLIWPILTFLALKTIFVPIFSLDLPKPSFFFPLVTSWRFVTFSALTYHWGTLLKFAFPFVLGFLIPLALLDDTLIFFSPEKALYFQFAAVILWWIFAPFGIASARRLFMLLGNAWEQELFKLSKKD